jgi:hypothetical protein
MEDAMKDLTLVREEGVFSVVSPLGEKVIEMIDMAPRLDTLEGKTVCTIWNTAFKSDVTLAKIEEILKARYPGLKTISYTEMPSYNPIVYATPQTRHKAIAEVVAALRNRGCNAIISGNGG